MGEHALGHVDDQILKLSTGFAGGIGCGYQDVCGALSAGVLIIGARHGRTRPDVDDSLCQATATHFRDRFVQAFGTTCCEELRKHHRPCSSLVQHASQIFLMILEPEGSV